jgi:hemolysin activation/secretion protein
MTTRFNVTSIRSTVLALATIALSQSALAQQPTGSGGGIQQIPQAPQPQPPAPDLPIRRDRAPTALPPEGQKFVVNGLRITGQSRFSEATLLAVTDFKPGSALNLSDLRALAAQIIGFYHQNGFFVAQSYLPPQEIKDGVVTIAVIEGRYGKVSLDNQTHVSDGVLNGILSGLDEGDPVETPPLARRLLILSDLPGVVVRSNLAPGNAVGTSNLTVSITPGQRVTGNVEADNWGNPYTGAYRIGGTVNLNEPLGIGDVLSARVLASTSGGMKYGRFSYQSQLMDGTVGVAFTTYEYRLGKQFESLDANGTERIFSVYGSYPLIRSYDNNLYAFADVDFRTFEDRVDATFSVVEREADVLTVGLRGNSRDRYWGGGWNAYSVALTLGELDIQTPAARVIDAATARTDGGYGTLSYSVSRLQHVAGPVSLYGHVRGQWAFDNLDSSEKMELGGATNVRAYPEGESYGDQGYVATLEARLLLTDLSERVPGDVQLTAFVDTGSVTFSKSPWYSGTNEATRSGIGVGLIWSDANDFEVTVAYAHRISTPATSAPDRFGRIWIRGVKYF